jgi:hypothetical protein
MEKGCRRLAIKVVVVVNSLVRRKSAKSFFLHTYRYFKFLLYAKWAASAFAKCRNRNEMRRWENSDKE